MSKEWILNSATNRFQLNFKRNVGATSESIRKCAPKSLEEWKSYYYENVKTVDHIESLGRKLFVKITEIIKQEVDEISEQDCIDYIKNLVINRTYDGYIREIETIYGQLQNQLGVKVTAAPDEWDRLFNVDFYIEIKNKFIGLQIKPMNKNIQLAEIFKEKDIQEKSHVKFSSKFGGKVFYIYSITENDKKIIQNPEVIEEIKNEIERLKQSDL